MDNSGPVYLGGMFGRHDKPAPVPPPTLGEYTDVVRRLGRLEAEVETLHLQWAGYRDEMKRLANRLERRDQRAAERESRSPEGSNGGPPPVEALDPISARVLARRQHELRHSPGEG